MLSHYFELRHLLKYFYQYDSLENDDPTPCLTHLGLSRVLNSNPTHAIIASDVGGSVRWMSPELFRHSKLQRCDDVWNYGLSVLVNFAYTPI